jgi:hypothetical protein
VEVFTADGIEGLPKGDRLEQLLELTPNLQLGTGSEGPAIRGQDSTGALQNLFAFLGGTRPRATLQVDGRPLGFNEFVFGSSPLLGCPPGRDLPHAADDNAGPQRDRGRHLHRDRRAVDDADGRRPASGRNLLIAGNIRAALIVWNIFGIWSGQARPFTHIVPRQWKGSKTLSSS